MTKIDRSSIWQRFIDRTETGKLLKHKQESMATPPDLGYGSVGMEELTFDERVRIGLAAIDTLGANGVTKALEVYVNAALLNAFGMQIQNDPEYAHLLHDVLETLEYSPDYQDFAELVLQELKNA